MSILNPTEHLKQSGKQSGIFHFKQFSVEDGQSTMKVGTDAVLLGAVADIGGAGDILEIGTGCGIISLIMAQRSDAYIDAVEIDNESAAEAVRNSERSPWAGRINILHQSIQQFCQIATKRYDLVISNPPFFSCSLKSPDRKRNLSRHNDSLSYEELLGSAARLMKAEASFWVILPASEFENFNLLANAAGLILHQKISVISKEGRKGHRVIMQLKKIMPGNYQDSIITILNHAGKYTNDYKILTKDFYLDF